jgi:uncharacterized DUF497 family protein
LFAGRILLNLGNTADRVDNRWSTVYSVNMEYIRFQWDAHKSVVNQRKHGVSFEEAQSAFYDPQARVMADPEHSETEDRFLLLGMSLSLRILVVCHCYRESEEVIRIISARRATKKEAGQYGSLG